MQELKTANAQLEAEAAKEAEAEAEEQRLRDEVAGLEVGSIDVLES